MDVTLVLAEIAGITVTLGIALVWWIAARHSN